jgi:hypothetical protein
MPVLRYSNDFPPGPSWLTNRAREIKEAWRDSFRPNADPSSEVVDVRRWLCLPQRGQPPQFFSWITDHTKATGIIFRDAPSTLTDIETTRAASVMTCLQTIQTVVACNAEPTRRRVVLVGTSIDAMTSNPFSWSWPANRFPGISFLVAISPPPDISHINIPTFSTFPDGSEIRWCFYPVDLLAALYQPEPHEMDRDVQLSPIHVDIGAYHADVVDAQKVVHCQNSSRVTGGSRAYIHLSFEAFGNDF